MRRAESKTAIAALKDARSGRWWIGTDTLATDGWGRPFDVGPKFCEILPGFVIAGSGSCRVIQLVEFSLRAWYQRGESEIPKTLDDVIALGDYIREALSKFRSTTREKDEEEVGAETMPAYFLIVIGDKCYELDMDFAVLEMQEAASIGCGADLAIAAMDALKESGLYSGEIVRRAIEVANKHSVFCGGEIATIEVPSEVEVPPSRKGKRRKSRRNPKGK